MSAENRLREAAIAAEDAAAAMYSRGTMSAGEHHEVIALARVATVMHELADRRDAADFTEPEAPPADVVWISRADGDAIEKILFWCVGDEAKRLVNVLREALA
jgi:hypothetical protein